MENSGQEIDAIDHHNGLEEGRNIATKDETRVKKIEDIICQGILVESVPNSQCLIFHTPAKFISKNDESYMPYVVSIGPYHHDRKRCKSMERRKKKYCMELIERTNTLTCSEIILKMTRYERLLRDSYENTDKFDSDSLLAMVIIDGCFILEYMLKSCYDNYTSQDTNIDHINHINHDILLQENQIPFEILKFLFKSTAPIPNVEAEMSKGNLVPREIFKRIKPYKKDYDVPTKEQARASTVQPRVQNGKCVLLREFFKRITTHKKDNKVPAVANTPLSTTKIDVWDEILVLLIREFFKEINTFEEDDEVPNPGEVMHITDLIRKLHEPKNQITDLDPKYIDSKFTTNATRLHEAGVKFKAVSGKGLLDIEFKNRCLEIPIFEINEDRLSLYRNLMVLELRHYPSNTFITDYFVFMDILIDSSDDVNLLLRNGVLYNRHGHYSQTADFFNNFCGGVTYRSDTSYLTSICAELDAYYKVPRNSWWTAFKRDYFGTPIRGASSFAAFMLVVLTLVSTVIAVLDYKK